MAQKFTAEVVEEVKKLKGQKRSAKQIVERVAKKGHTLTVDDVTAILEVATANGATEESLKAGANKSLKDVVKEQAEAGIIGSTSGNPTPAEVKKETEEKVAKGGKKVTGTHSTSRGKPFKTPGPQTEAVVTDTVHAGGGIMVDIVEKKPVATKKVSDVTTVKAEPHPFPVKGESGIYHIKGGKLNLFALLTPEQAVIRNASRKDDYRWLPVKASDVPQGTGVEDFNGATIALEEKAQEVKEKKAKTVNPDGTPKSKKESVIREAWNGMGMCAFLRYLGATFPKEEKAVLSAVAVKAGFDPDHTTVKIQTRKGRNGDKVPAPDAKVAKEVKEMVKAAKSEVAEKAE